MSNPNDLLPTSPLRVVGDDPDPRAATMVVVWLGSAAPTRSVRWLDGTCQAAAKFGNAIAVAAGDATWLDLAADRATRAQLASIGVPTKLELDYLGWAQVAAAAARQLGARTVLVDEASRPDRSVAEVCAIAELLDAAQLTHVVAIAPDGPTFHASRVTSSSELQTCLVRGPAVIGLRIAGPAIEEYPTPTPSTQMKRLDLPALGLDPVVLGHRGLPPRASQPARKSIDKVADYLAFHVRPSTKEG